MNKKFLFMFLFSACLVSNLKPLSDSEVNVISGAVGTGVGLTTGICAAAIAFDDSGEQFRRRHTRGSNIYYENETSLLAYSAGPVVGLISGGLTFWAIRDFLKYFYTPQGRYDRAVDLIDDIKDDFIFSKADIAQEELIKYVNAEWTSRWPLISAKEKFSSIQNKLKNALKNLNKAISELKKDRREIELLNDCKTVKGIIFGYLELITDRINFIVGHKDYNFQMNLYHESIEKQKDRNEYAMQSSLNRWSNERVSNRPVEMNVHHW